MRGIAVASRSALPTMTAAARVPESSSRYLLRVRKLKSLGPALARVARPVTSVSASPTSSPPIRFASSPSRKRLAEGTSSLPGFGRRSLAGGPGLRRALPVESLDDPLGDVGARVDPHHLVALEHDVELLRLGDALHDLVGAHDDGVEL